MELDEYEEKFTTINEHKPLWVFCKSLSHGDITETITTSFVFDLSQSEVASYKCSLA